MPAATYEAHAPPPNAFAPPDTLRLAKRFCWKEAKRLAGVGAAVFVLAALVILVLPEIAPRADWLTGRLVIALGAAALMAVASVVTAFAVEREEGTAELLRILPRNRAALLLGKLAGAALVVLAVALAGLLAAGLMNGWRLPDQGATILNQGALAIAEAFVFGLLASLVCPQPLLAAVIGMGLASLNSQVAIALWVQSSHGFTLADYVRASPMRLALLATFALVDGWLGWRWLQGLSLPRFRRRAATTTNMRKSYRRSWLVVFTRLCWQSFRQSWKTMLVAAVVGPFLSICVAFLFASSGTPIVALAFLAVLFTPALMGALAFRADQRGRSYRFLAEHAGRPRTAWLAQQAVCLSIVIVTPFALAVVYCGLLYLTDHDHLLNMSLTSELSYLRRYSDIESERALLIEMIHQAYRGAVFALVGGCAWLTAYAFGQLASIAVRSDVLAGMAALFVSVVIAAWSILMAYWRLDPLWTIAPLGVAAMAAGYWRSRDWMFDRSGAWRWSIPLLLALTPLAYILPAIPVARLSQVTVGPPGLRTPYLGYFTRYPGGQITDLEQETRAKLARGRELADTYERLAYADNVGSDAWFQEVIQLSKQDGILPTNFRPGDARWAVTEQILASLLDDTAPGVSGTASIDQLLAARRFAKQCCKPMHFWYRTDADLLRRIKSDLVVWASAPGRTSQEVKDAIAELRDVDSPFNGAELIAKQAIPVRAAIRGEAPPISLSHEHTVFVGWLGWILNAMPGEADRAERALDILATQELDWCYALNALRDRAANSPAIAHDFCVRHLGRRSELSPVLPLVAPSIAAEAGLPRDYKGTNLQHWMDLTRQAQTSLLAVNEWWIADLFEHEYSESTRGHVYEGAERVRLALIAYRIDNGEYPKSLDGLLGEYLSEQELRSPYSGARFGYRANGFDAPAFDSMRVEFIADAETPMLWCTGAAVVQTVVMAYGEDGALRGISEDGDALSDEVLREKKVAFLDGNQYWNFWMPLPKQLNSPATSRPQESN